MCECVLFCLHINKSSVYRKKQQIVIKRLSTFLVDCNVPTNILWVIQTVWWFLHDKNYIVTSEFILMLFRWFVNGMPDFVSSTKWNSHIYFLHYVWLGLLPFFVIFDYNRNYLCHSRPFYQLETTFRAYYCFLFSIPFQWFNRKIYWLKITNFSSLHIDSFYCVFSNVYQ